MPSPTAPNALTSMQFAREIYYRWDPVPKPRSYYFFRGAILETRPELTVNPPADAVAGGKNARGVGLFIRTTSVRDASIVIRRY